MINRFHVQNAQTAQWALEKACRVKLEIMHYGGQMDLRYSIEGDVMLHDEDGPRCENVRLLRDLVGLFLQRRIDPEPPCEEAM